MAEKATGKSVGEVEVQLKRGSDYGVLSFLVGSTTMLGDTEDEMKKELGIGHEALLQSLARLEGAGLVTSAICQTGTASLSRRYQATKGLRIRLVREFQTVQQM